MFAVFNPGRTFCANDPEVEVDVELRATTPATVTEVVSWLRDTGNVFAVEDFQNAGVDGAELREIDNLRSVSHH